MATRLRIASVGRTGVRASLSSPSPAGDRKPTNAAPTRRDSITISRSPSPFSSSIGCCGARGRAIAESVAASAPAGRWRGVKLAREHRAQLLEIVYALRRLAQRTHVDGRGTIERAVLHLCRFERVQSAPQACAESAPGGLGQ